VAPCSPTIRQDFALQQRRQHGQVARPVEQPQQPQHGIEQFGGSIGDDQPGGRATGPLEALRAGFQQQLGDAGRVQHQAEAARRLFRAGADELAGDRQVDRGDQILAPTIAIEPVAQRQALLALGDQRHHRAGGRVFLDRGVVFGEQHALDRRRRIGPGMAGDQRIEFIDRHEA